MYKIKGLSFKVRTVLRKVVQLKIKNPKSCLSQTKKILTINFAILSTLTVLFETHVNKYWVL